MHICYLDESGCTGTLPAANSQIQPVFVLGGVFLAKQSISPVTRGLLALKQKFFPKLLPAHARYHDWMAAEIKGADIRKKARSSNRNDRRFAYMVIDGVLRILEAHNAKVVARVYVKPVGGFFDGPAVYTSTVQAVCAAFQEFLCHKNSLGLVVADSRTKGKNSVVSHSIFTQRFRMLGDPYSALVEVPTFGHSDNHAGLQMTDFICSALLYPIAAQVCCAGHMTDHTHLSVHYDSLRSRYGGRIQNLQHRYRDGEGLWRGGVTLVDPVNKRNAKALFA